MRISKCFIGLALALLPVASLWAAAPKDSMRVRNYPPDSIRVRYHSWSLYGAGGVCGFLDLQGYDDEIERTTLSPDFAIGFKNNVRPWFRWGMNFGYTFLHTINDRIDKSETVTPGFTIGNYSDAVLTVDKVVYNHQHDQQMAYGDLNVDFNIFQMGRRGDHRVNCWLGAGAGYLHGWTLATRMTAVDEEAVTPESATDHFDVYNHSYVVTETQTSHQNSPYAVGRVALEIDLTTRWTLGFRGEYKYFPLKQDLTPLGMWTGGLSLAYNFVPKAKRKTTAKPTAPQLSGSTHTTDTVFVQQLVHDTLVQHVREAVETMAVSPVFFDKNKSTISPDMKKTLIFAKQLMEEYPDATLHIQGYASTEGWAWRNEELASQRAEAVREVLINTYGISSSRIVVEGCGATDKLYKALELNRAAVLRIERPIGE